MQQVIEDWLAYTVQRDGLLAPTEVPLKPLVEAIVVAPVASGGDDLAPVFDVDVDDTVQADPALTRQLVANLVSNAVKYTPPGDPPPGLDPVRTPTRSPASSGSASPTAASASPRARRSWSSRSSTGRRATPPPTPAPAWASRCAARSWTATAARSAPATTRTPAPIFSFTLPAA